MREIVRKGSLLVDYLLWLIFLTKECVSCPALLPPKNDGYHRVCGERWVWWWRG